MVGSTVGLGVGYLLALGLRWLFGVFGLDLSRADFPMTWTAVFWSYVVGVGVTAVAALLPARRAARIAPIAALRDDVALPESSLRRRSRDRAACSSWWAPGPWQSVSRAGETWALIGIGGGILLVLVGVFIMSAFLGRPVLHLFGAVYRRTFGMVGRLAAQNALRNPRRTGATASALMIGLALMAMMSIFGQLGLGQHRRRHRQVADLAVHRVQRRRPAVLDRRRRPDPSARRSLRRDPAAQRLPRARGGRERVDRRSRPEGVRARLPVPTVAGSFADLGPGTVAVSEAQAKDKGYGIGDTVTMKFQATDIELRVVALFPSNPAVPGDYVVTPDTLEKGGLSPLDAMVMVTKDPSASTDTVRSEIEGVVQDLPTVTVKDPEGFAAEQKEQVNQFLYLIYGLLGLSVIIAILGVINTLSLSVIERTREVGLLRAVGVTRRQLRTMIRLESVVVAVLGGVLGTVLGVLFGAAMVTALKEDGLTELAIPWPLLVGFLLLAGFAGRARRCRSRPGGRPVSTFSGRSAPNRSIIVDNWSTNRTVVG